MLSFILAVFTSALVSVLMRLGGKHAKNNITMLCFNYIMCTVLAVLCTQTTDLLPQAEGSGLTLGMGLVNGAFYLGGFVLLQWNIRKNGVVLPATFMKLGVLVPTVMAILVFGEQPTAAQLAGIAAAIFAIVLIQFEKGQGKAAHAAGLIALLLVGGTADGMSKVYEFYGTPALENHFLLYTFFSAMVLCIGLAVVKRQSIAWADVGFGLLIGVPNYFTARFLLQSLSAIPAVVAYPAYSVGTIVLVTLAGRVLFKEKLSRRQIAALAIILAALALLNL